ncbi:MAG: zinc-dependent metalloprotease, partial [Bacteroidota bacterium]
MSKILPLLIGLCLIACRPTQGLQGQPTTDDDTQDVLGKFVAEMQAFPGYMPFYWDAKKGKIYLEVSRLEEEFLYVNSLAAGLGSNDVGLDRGQLGRERVVYFKRFGPKLLLIQPNYKFRAQSDNPDEAASVAEAFAQSALAGFKIEKEANGRMLIDLTSFLMRDAHGVSGALKRSKQGSYSLDAQRSAVWLPRTKNFPQNTEFEALLTFKGQPQGGYVRDVTPSAEAITVRQHHSFVQLPDAEYQPRVFDPRSGYFPLSFKDYATPIDAPLVQRYITRHRLNKKNPRAARSEAVEPIIYYVDRGAPEPIRSALIEGASWWNQAFEAAGYKNAFQVKVMPADADPMDVRYNLIQWVHRSTRGWSYGGSVVDPRTGEIIKGHVSLGSLRVRQDYLIAQGLIVPFEEGQDPDPRMLEMALARLRQLSAHEVGHTIGLAHNFSASVNNRASVMDYPHPYLAMDANEKVDFTAAYDVGIGEWDKRTVLYGYQDFAPKVDEAKALQDILAENKAMGLFYHSDMDARPFGSASPTAHLWDNGTDPAVELNRLLAVRKKALNQFSEKQIPVGRPMGELEEVLVPVYFAHRYQVEATAKVIGGVQYSYAVRGDGDKPQIVSADQQKAAFEALLGVLQPEQLALPEHILALIPPRPMGYQRGRENFKLRTNFTLDPLTVAETAADQVLTLLLEPARAARVTEFAARDASQKSFNSLLQQLVASVWEGGDASGYHRAIRRVVQYRLAVHLMRLQARESAAPAVRAA